MPGYERDRFVNVTEEEKTDLTCSVCHQIFRHPVIADCCLQAFCEVCIHEWLKNDSTCPYDRKQLSVKELRPSPRLLSNLLGKLQISCEFRDRGCEEIIRLEDLNEHIDNCPFNIRICKTCFCVTKVSHNCVKELLDLNKKENELIDGLRHEKEVFRQLFDEINEKHNKENEVLMNEKKNLQKTVHDLKQKYEIQIQKLSFDNEKLQERLERFQGDSKSTLGLFRTSSTLSLDSRGPTFQEMLSEARKYVSQRVTITEANTDEVVSTRIVEIVKNEIRSKNNMYFICQDVVYKLDNEFGSSWGCIANYDKHGNNYTNSTCFVKLKFGKLVFKIFRVRFLDVPLLRRRFREGRVKREIKVFDTDMTDHQITIVEKVTFSAIDKSKSLKKLTLHIQNQLEGQIGGQWQCFAHNFGDYCIHKKHGTFISFDIEDLKLILFQAN